MRASVLLVLLFLAGGSRAFAAEDPEIPPAEYASRRARLMAAHSDGLIIVHSRFESPAWAEGGFRQDRNFYYLTGWDVFGAVLVLDSPRKEARVFLRGKGEALGIGTYAGVGAYDQFVPFVNGRLKEGVKKIYDVSVPPDFAHQLPPHEYSGKQRENLQRLFPRATFASVRPALMQLRWVKSPAEIAVLRRAGWTSAASLRAAMRGIRAGRSQRDVEAEAIQSCMQNGSEGHSFWPWIMSGPNSVYPAPSGGWLNYRFLNRTMQSGEVVWIDLGCARGHYEGDLGRTVPVAGKFTEEQREVYEILLRGYEAARAAIRPGATVADARKAYYDAVRQATPKSELARAAIADEAKESEKPDALFLHSVGISAVERPGERFEPGVVVALEPQIVFPGRNMGFFIEDMLLVNATGNELLTAGLPYTAEEIEAFMATPAASPYTTVDVHTHMDPPQHTAEQLIRWMNILGISKSIIFGGPRADHEYVLKAAEKYPDRLVPFYRASVREEQDAWLANDPRILAELDRQLASGRFKGIGEFSNVHYPPGRKARMGDALLETEVSPLAPMVIKMFELADKYRLPVLVHNEVYYYREFDELLSKFPRVPVIWAHAGYVNYYGIDMALKKHANLYIDLSIRALYRPRDLREASIFHDEDTLKPMWRDLIEKYPDRFMTGLDESSAKYAGHEASFLWTAKMLSQLTPATARKVAVENIERLLESRSEK